MNTPTDLEILKLAAKELGYEFNETWFLTRNCPRLETDPLELINFGRALLASAWQPIETAPRDGTTILGWDGQDMAVVRWSVGCLEIWDLAACGTYAIDGQWNPTYWQPLPNPPPFTPSEPHALTEGQRITVDGIRGPYADLNGAYAVDSVNPGTITP